MFVFSLWIIFRQFKKRRKIVEISKFKIFVENKIKKLFLGNKKVYFYLVYFIFKCQDHVRDIFIIFFVSDQ